MHYMIRFHGCKAAMSDKEYFTAVKQADIRNGNRFDMTVAEISERFPPKDGHQEALARAKGSCEEDRRILLAELFVWS